MASQQDTPSGETLDLDGASAHVNDTPAPRRRSRRASSAPTAPATVEVLTVADENGSSATDPVPDPPKRRRRSTPTTAAPAGGTPDGTDASQAAAEEAPLLASSGEQDAPAKGRRRKAVTAGTPDTTLDATAVKAAKAPTRRTKKAAAEPEDGVANDATEPSEETEDAEETEETSDAVAPVEDRPAAFGVLFQAADPAASPSRRSRRASSPAGAPSARAALDPSPATSEAADTTAVDPEADAMDADATDTNTEAEAGRLAAETGPSDGDVPEESRSAGRRRRRRGGRGRSRTADEVAADSEGSGEDGDDASGEGPTEAADSSSELSNSSRRRRRRRRSGSSADGDDPPGTFTKVPQTRAKDEVTGLKGSTRLEAKKQRRREGREAGRRRTIITEAEFLARRESVDRVMVVRGRDGRTQIGVLEDKVLVEHYVSRETTASMAGNVYLGRVQNVLPSMEAAFVDIGRGRNAVLYAGEVNWDAAGLEHNQAKRIENALSSGDTVLVQVTKDPIGHKGARLTSQVSLPGRFLVYVPEGNMTGISRKLPDTERARLKAILKEVVPDSAGVIVRTAAEGASEEELRADVERLTRTWERIQSKAEAARAKKSGSGGAPTLLHGEPDLTVRVIRDIFNEDFSQLIVSGDEAWQQVHDYVSDVAPDLLGRLVRWTENKDVFGAHRIDEQLAKALDRKVWLPSGGSLVIDRTEAMTVVDVNTGKFIGSGGNLEETVTRNNIEAAEEIVRQLRVRDIGGIIVIDFIDMVLESNRDLVVRRLLECLGRDRTKHQVAEVTSLGLVQMTRKRVGSGLLEVFSEPCDCCNGRGLVIHTDPVDKAAGAVAQEAPAPRRRGRGAATEDAAPAVVTHSGPTAAQIAAAAHAAALKATEHGEHVDVVIDAVVLPAEAGEVSVPEPSTVPAAVVERPRRRRARSAATAPAAAAHPVEG